MCLCTFRIIWRYSKARIHLPFKKSILYYRAGTVSILSVFCSVSIWFSTFGHGLLTEWSLRISCACLNLLQHQKWKLLKETGELMSTSISGIICCWLGMTFISISVVGRGAKGCAVAMEMMVWSLGLCWSPEALGAVDNACWWRRTMQIQL